MQREIKFRAWNFVAKKMYYPENAGNIFLWQKEGQVQQVMQYTGLKDKNGKGIFEGDILKDTLTTCHLQVHFGYNRNGGYTGWYVSYLNIDRNGFSAINADYDTDINSQIEVIGNVHENPELLP